MMFYNYASLVLAIAGAVVGLTGYYLDNVLQVSFQRLLWVGATILLTLGGLIIGRLLQRLHLSSQTDILTGLWNRRYFYLTLGEEEFRATRKKTPLCVAMIDVDNFKKVNDSYGHAIGDVILSGIATLLSENTRARDVVTRWGGDEFAIIFPDTNRNRRDYGEASPQS